MCGIKQSQFQHVIAVRTSNNNECFIKPPCFVARPHALLYVSACHHVDSELCLRTLLRCGKLCSFLSCLHFWQTSLKEQSRHSWHIIWSLLKRSKIFRWYNTTKMRKGTSHTSREVGGVRSETSCSCVFYQRVQIWTWRLLMHGWRYNTGLPWMPKHSCTAHAAPCKATIPCQRVFLGSQT